MNPEQVALRINELYEQEARTQLDPNHADWKARLAASHQRRVEVLGFLEQRLVTSSEALYQAAVIFQNGGTSEFYKLAHQLAERAMELGSLKARWIYAAAMDRYLLSNGKLQKFGTQMVQTIDGRRSLQPVEPTTTDEERLKYGVPSLVELERRVLEWNAKL
jgi:hypothetical protein